MKVIHPLTVDSELQDAYLRYVDTTYWLRHPDLMKERREILKQYGRLFTEFHLEPIAQYDATIDLLDFANRETSTIQPTLGWNYNGTGFFCGGGGVGRQHFGGVVGCSRGRIPPATLLRV